MRRTVQVLFVASGVDLRVEVAVLRDEIVPALRRWCGARRLDVEVYGSWTLDDPSVEHTHQHPPVASEDPASTELRRLAQDPEVFFVAVLSGWSPPLDRTIVQDFCNLRQGDHSRGCLFLDQQTPLPAADLPDWAWAQAHRLPDAAAGYAVGPGPGDEPYRLILDTLIEVIEAAIGPFDAEPADEPTGPVIDENVQFTVFRPQVVRPGVWYPLLAFAHLAERSPDAPPDQLDPLDRVRTWAAQILGSDMEAYASPTSDARAGVPRESELTFVPEIDGMEFNPPRRTFRWLEDVHKEEFRLRASPALTGSVARGRLTVFLGVLILADVELAIRIASTAATPTLQPAASQTPSRTIDPREVALEAVHAHPYRKIFPSYSHLDVAIVEQAEVLGRALGDVYVRDRTVLRSGEDWNARLLELIDEADIFQLFWSSNAMRSEYVRQEWEYALSRGRRFFIRPTYWEEPMPRSTDPELPPPKLSQLHFQSLRRDALADPVAEAPTGDHPPPRTVDPARPQSKAVRPEAPRRYPGPGRICDVCGTANPPDAEFCRSCYSYLAWDSREVPAAPREAERPLPVPGAGDVLLPASASDRPGGPSAASPPTPPSYSETPAAVNPAQPRPVRSRPAWLPLVALVVVTFAVALLIWVVSSR